MRRSLAPLAAIAGAAALAMAGCGSNSSSSGDSASGTATQAASTSSGGMKVAVLLPGSPTDQGYNADGQRSADLIKKQLGADVTVTQNVSVPNQADVYRQYASKGYDLVIGWGGQFTDGATTVAAEFPKVQFLVVNSTAKNGTNLSSMDENIQDWEFVGGYVTAKLSKSGTIGWVGSLCIPPTAANLHGFEQGAKYANPAIKVKSTFTGDFEDPTKAQQASQAMIDSGADALSGNMNNGWFGLLKAAQAKNVPTVTEWVDNSSLAKDVIASSILKTQATFLADLAAQAQKGSLGGKQFQYTMTADSGPAVSKTALLPKPIYDEALGVQKKIVDGSLKPKVDTSCPK
ncbi:MAG TPA: BMP family protein [Baekduia sp.]|uniref:BMP family protein n=1 Tax=Baekduia sp. TaxID=2600305 RepID=UPI002CD4FEE7|nr:BMP family protein [Baekduia sp.]HMJ35601.1 BMP family protein [Baekduia sp.]